MTITGWVESPLFLEHATGPGHPERPARLIALRDRIESTGLLDELDIASAPEASEDDLTLVHPPGYVAHVTQAAESGAPYVDSPDANLGRESARAARAAAGGALLAVDRVVKGEWDNAFVAARPPGHHAERALAMGFCFFNSVVVAARHLQERHGIERVAIVDFDVHHGNGTQHLTEEDPTLFYASLHQYPHYPGTGAASERGRDEGVGTVVNCPLAAGTGDREWLAAFERVVLPALEAFDPGFVLVSAGFDAHARDPLSSTLLTSEAYGTLTNGLLQVARARCGGRLVGLLEGGYDLEGLASSAREHLAALRGGPS